MSGYTASLIVGTLILAGLFLWMGWMLLDLHRLCKRLLVEPEPDAFLVSPHVWVKPPPDVDGQRFAETMRRELSRARPAPYDQETE